MRAEISLQHTHSIAPFLKNHHTSMDGIYPGPVLVSSILFTAAVSSGALLFSRSYHYVVRYSYEYYTPCNTIVVSQIRGHMSGSPRYRWCRSVLSREYFTQSFLPSSTLVELRSIQYIPVS